MSDPYQLGERRKVRSLVRLLRRRDNRAEPAVFVIDLLARSESRPDELARAVEPLIAILQAAGRWVDCQRDRRKLPAHTHPSITAAIGQLITRRSALTWRQPEVAPP